MRVEDVKEHIEGMCVGACSPSVSYLARAFALACTKINSFIC